MAKYADLRATLIGLSGQQNCIVVHRAFVEFTGSLEAGMLLGQLLYWTPRSQDGWVAKTDADWCAELCLSAYGVRVARKRLEGLGVLETKVKRFAGSPTVHYHLLWPALEQKWILWIQQSDLANSQEPPCESTSSITEITTETTSEKISLDSNESNDSAEGALSKKENSIPSSKTSSSEAPSSKALSLSTKTVMPRTHSPAEAYLFEQFHRRRWATQAQAELFGKTERDVGSEVMMAACRWAAENGIAKVTSICTAAKRIASEGTQKEVPRKEEPKLVKKIAIHPFTGERFEVEVPGG